MIKVPRFEDSQLGRECYLHKRTESIREKLARMAQLEALETRGRVDITHVDVAGEEMVMQQMVRAGRKNRRYSCFADFLRDEELV